MQPRWAFVRMRLCSQRLNTHSPPHNQICVPCVLRLERIPNRMLGFMSAVAMPASLQTPTAGSRSTAAPRTGCTQMAPVSINTISTNITTSRKLHYGRDFRPAYQLAVLRPSYPPWREPANWLGCCRLRFRHCPSTISDRMVSTVQCLSATHLHALKYNGIGTYQIPIMCRRKLFGQWGSRAKKK